MKSKTPIADSIMDWILKPTGIEEPKKTRVFQLSKEEIAKLKENQKSKKS